MTAGPAQTTFAGLLSEDRVSVTLESDDIEGAVHELHRLILDSGALTGVAPEALVEKMVEREGVVVRAAGEAVLVVGVVSPGLEAAVASLGVSRLGLDPAGQLPEHPARIRVIMLVFSPRGVGEIRRQLVPRAGFCLASERVLPGLLRAVSPKAVTEMPELMEARIAGQMRVEDAMVPAPYRVFPNTPIMEVLELASRRNLGAVPVVGEDFEVLGIISQSDLIERLLPVWISSAEGEETAAEQQTARDLMGRSVLCVSEEASLAEAAVQMMNRGVAQLPVVREGQLVGMLERRTVLRALNERLAADWKGSKETETGGSEGT